MEQAAVSGGSIVGIITARNGIHRRLESLQRSRLIKACIMFHHPPPPCPTCQTTTRLARISPGPSGSEIRAFECPACNQVHQMVVERPDPMTSPETNGWLHGQLQAPT
jgi:hypothetical protein